jgi:asparagine synthase (glutamine-hydrolysing)
MCGIGGMQTSGGRAADPAIIAAMRSALSHRGPDGNGTHIAGSVSLFNTRLAIIDLATGDQPLQDAAGVTLVANGEIYNDPELRAAMPDAHFRTGSDCESPLHLYSRKGLGFVDDLRGMYAIAIHDPASSRLLLTRDPFGIKPLYYVETSDFFAFASEPQALIAAGLVKPTIRPRARAELFQLKFTTGRETIFAGIQRALPGETLIVEDGKIVERRRRLALPEGAPQKIAHACALRTLDGILRDTVVHHIRSDVPYGLFLSSGIDSTALVHLMKRCSSNPIVAFTVTFPGSRAADELAHARRVAGAVGAEHHVLELTEREFWALAPRVAEALDDPTTDPATVPTYALAAMAKNFVKVVLTGEGGDEMFCGYSRYRRARWLGGMFTRNARTHGEFDRVAHVNGAFDGWRDGLALAERNEARTDRTFIQKLQAADCAEWLPNDLLIKLDRCLMANGLEGRTPFLDPVVAEFAFRLPDEMKATTSMSKRLLRDWLAANVPSAEPYASKLGFNPPIGEWIARRKAAIEELVATAPGINEVFSRDVVRRGFADPERNHVAAWSLLFYALWHSHHVLGISAAGNVEDVLDAARHAS